MGRIVYIERAVKNLDFTAQLLTRLHPSQIVYCEHYQNIFNPKSQDFRQQKENPATILAQKHGKRVFETPEDLGIGGMKNYYFSHMLNCLYDCRYCFLQGMFPSAHYVIFVNYQDFWDDIETLCKQSDAPHYFFSGYDCDSLAMDPITGFLDFFLPKFAVQDNAHLELRTKSVNIRALLQQPVNPRVITAFSFTPHEISKQLEHRVPSVEKRIQAMQTLAKQGWPIGLRFDPLIDAPDFETQYRGLIKSIFKHISPDTIHSVSIGPLRFPEKMFHKIVKLYPDDPLYAQNFQKRNKHYSYSDTRESEMKMQLTHALSHYINPQQIFTCSNL